MTTRTAAAGRTRDRLLRAARDHFADRRYDDVTLADIASAAIQQGQYDRGVAFARQSIAVTTAHQVGLGAKRLHQIHQMIDSRRHITVLAELDDLILDQVA